MLPTRLMKDVTEWADDQFCGWYGVHAARHAVIMHAIRINPNMWMPQSIRTSSTCKYSCCTY